MIALPVWFDERAMMTMPANVVILVSSRGVVLIRGLWWPLDWDAQVRPSAALARALNRR